MESTNEKINIRKSFSLLQYLGCNYFIAGYSIYWNINADRKHHIKSNNIVKFFSYDLGSEFAASTFAYHNLPKNEVTYRNEVFLAKVSFAQGASNMLKLNLDLKQIIPALSKKNILLTENKVLENIRNRIRAIHGQKANDAFTLGHQTYNSLIELNLKSKQNVKNSSIKVFIETQNSKLNEWNKIAVDLGWNSVKFKTAGNIKGLIESINNARKDIRDNYLIIE